MASLARLLVFALVLLIPLQGMAALSVAQCMTLGHHQGAMDHDGQNDGHDHQHDGAAQDEGDQSGHCGPCVACCASAAIAPATTIGIPDHPAASARPAEPPFFAGIAPAKLDRPPLAL